MPEPGFGVSRETHERLLIYADLLARWQRRINLVSDATMPNLWRRHFQDSLQLRAIAPEARRWIDLGSGAGFPGLVIAIDLAVSEPDATVHLVESNGKKASFLREVCRETGARAMVVNQRIEEALPAIVGKAVPDVITSRALAPLPQLLGYTEHMLKTPTRGLFLKGQDIDAELTESAKCWNLKFRKHDSAVDQRGCIIEVLAADRILPALP